MPVEFDETLRGLQKLIKSQKSGGVTAKKSKFKRQTYRQITVRLQRTVMLALWRSSEKDRDTWALIVR